MNPDLTNLRAECERAIELDTRATPGPWTEFLNLVYEGPENVIADCLDGDTKCNAEAIAHSRTHSPRASRALLIAVEAINKLTEFASVNSDAWFVGKKAVAAIAAEFSGEEARELTRGLVASRPRILP